MPQDPHTLVLKIEGLPEGQIPLSLLADKLHAAQRLILNIGSAIRGAGRRGAWRSEVIQSCTLVFMEARPGSLEVTTQLAVGPPVLARVDHDLGIEALARTGLTLKAIKDKDRERLRHYFPDFGHRSRILKSALSLLPEQEAQYDIALSTSTVEVKLGTSLRDYVVDLAREETEEIPQEEIRRLTGKLYLIEVATGQRQLGLVVNNRHIHCFYTQDFEDVIRELIPGSLVEVEGRATLDETGNIQRIEEILDVVPVQLVPLFWSSLIFENRRFRLNQPIQITPIFNEGVWVHEYEPLKIMAPGNSRHDSLQTFKMEFAACWDELAHEEDNKLTQDAQGVKNQLLALVQHIETAQ
jgi:hypothetical protein